VRCVLWQCESCQLHQHKAWWCCLNQSEIISTTGTHSDKCTLCRSTEFLVAVTLSSYNRRTKLLWTPFSRDEWDF
jgi:hypothetical protein